MKTYTLTLTTNQMFLLEAIVYRKTEMLRGESTPGHTVPEAIEIQNLHRILMGTKPNEKEETNGKEKEVS